LRRPDVPELPLIRSNVFRFAFFVLPLGLVPVLACNAILGNEKRTLDEDLALKNDPPRPDGGQTPTTPNPTSDGGSTIPDEDAAPTDSGVDAAPLRMPDASCVKSTTPKDAVKKVEMDLSPTPVRNGDLTVSAYYTIYGDNALTNVRLDFCTPDGAKVDPGGGFNYLGGGGAVTRRWQTKNAVTLPFGRTQAQVIADGSPSLKLVWDIDIK